MAANARLFPALPNELAERIAGFLPANEVATTLRLVSSAAAALFAQRVQVQLSEPVPAHAFAAKWTPEVARELTAAQKRSLLALTARSGVLKNLEVALRVTDVGRLAAMEAAASSGRVAVVKHVYAWMKRTKQPPPQAHEQELVVEAAAAAGHVDLLLWLRRQRGVRMTGHANLPALERAVLGGHTEAAMLLLRGFQHRYPGTDWCDVDGLMELPCLAAFKGHFALAEQLLAQVPAEMLQAPELRELLACGAAGCSLPQLQALVARELRVRGHPTAGVEGAGGGGPAAAAAGGAVVAVAAEQPGGAAAAAAAAAAWWGDDVEEAVLGDMFEGECVVAAAAASETPDWREKASATAECFTASASLVLLPLLAAAAHVQVEWLLAHGAPLPALYPAEPPCSVLEVHGWDRLQECGLVRGGGVERLAWLRGRGFALDEELGDAAAAQGRLEELDFLITLFGLRCISYNGVETACARGHLHILQALHARQYPFKVGPALESAARYGQMEVLQWLLRLPDPAAPAVGELRRLAAGPRTRAAAMPGAKYVNIDLVNAAVEGGNLQLLQLLLDLNPRLRLGLSTLEVAIRSVACVEPLFGYGTIGAGGASVGGAAGLPVLDVLMQQGLPMRTDGSPYVTAARGSEARAVITALARTYKCPWGPSGRVLRAVIWEGADLATLQCLMDAGCPVQLEDWAAIAAHAAISRDTAAAVRDWVIQQAAAAEKQLERERAAKEREVAAQERERKRKQQEKERERKRRQKEKEREKKKEKAAKDREKAKAAKEKAKEKAKKQAEKAKGKGQKAAGPIKKGAVKKRPAAAVKKSKAPPKKAAPKAAGAKGKKGGGGKGGSAAASAGSGGKAKH
ncbi:hypothetical protein HYH02_004832 [Chlamydomonas schloesseri]|uniref:Uncharacterized protein n=1 Tax=Chlamydomonas schloesseri TaxID=2026947 RepID=A0A835WMG0_9CHLO|nr:hypothetical protein HYH02_004832 [Chlamydomonas schloesseri]|eukprot:KAG2450327.1 hypothetical protein HYH02_004832 [Chlamydomonas schloesseri]